MLVTDTATTTTHVPTVVRARAVSISMLPDVELRLKRAARVEWERGDRTRGYSFSSWLVDIGLYGGAGAIEILLHKE